MKKLLESLKHIYELEVDADLKNKLAAGREEIRNARKRDVEHAQRWADRYPDDDFFKKDLEYALKKYKGSTAYDTLFKDLYDSNLHIDFDRAKIKKVDLPKSGKDLKSYLQRGNNFILSSPDGKLFLLTPQGYMRYSGKLISTIKTINGRDYDLTSPVNVSKAFNSGAFDNMWEIDAPSTEQIRADRYDNKRGMVVRGDADAYYNDASGYRKRDLKAELADKKRNDYVGQINKLKNDAINARKALIQKIKTSDIEDIDTNVLSNISKALEKVNTYNVNNWDLNDSDRAKKYLTAMQNDVNTLNNLIDNV